MTEISNKISDQKGAKKHMILKIVSAIILILLIAFSAGAYNMISNNLYYHERDMQKVWDAGFQEKQFKTGDTVLNYAEGPSNGPVLFLIHGQTTDWENYAPVLPKLSKKFHIYAVDCHGHGKSSKNPEKYNIEAMSDDFHAFITQVIKEPVIVSGHSSGGFLAAYMAANFPDAIRGVVLEDPPMFSTEFPRWKNHFTYHDLGITSHNFLLQSSEKSYVRYYMKNCFWMQLFVPEKGRKAITDYALSYNDRHPDSPIKIFFFPPVTAEGFRAINTYDPRFGETFYTRSWFKGINYDELLKKISCPSVLIHTSWQYKDGYLLGAMDEKDAERAHRDIKNNKLINVVSGHGFHFEKPDDYIQIVLDLNKSVTG